MNLLMKIDRYVGILLVVVAVLGYFFHWFTNQLLLSALAAGLILFVVSFTSDKGKRKANK